MLENIILSKNEVPKPIIHYILTYNVIEYYMGSNFVYAKQYFR